MALGRKVTIAGTVELEFSYWPVLEVSDAKIAKEPGASQPLGGELLLKLLQGADKSSGSKFANEMYST